MVSFATSQKIDLMTKNQFRTNITDSMKSKQAIKSTTHIKSIFIGLVAASLSMFAACTSGEEDVKKDDEDPIIEQNGDSHLVVEKNGWELLTLFPMDYDERGLEQFLDIEDHGSKYDLVFSFSYQHINNNTRTLLVKRVQFDKSGKVSLDKNITSIAINTLEKQVFDVKSNDITETGLQAITARNYVKSAVYENGSATEASLTPIHFASVTEVNLATGGCLDGKIPYIYTNKDVYPMIKILDETEPYFIYQNYGKLVGAFVKSPQVITMVSDYSRQYLEDSLLAISESIPALENWVYGDKSQLVRPVALKKIINKKDLMGAREGSFEIKISKYFIKDNLIHLFLSFKNQTSGFFTIDTDNYSITRNTDLNYNSNTSRAEYVQILEDRVGELIQTRDFKTYAHDTGKLEYKDIKVPSFKTSHVYRLFYKNGMMYLLVLTTQETLLYKKAL
jgi:hypothetical protein